jgi:uncharacterized coiled-coil protein SlyX
VPHPAPHRRLTVAVLVVVLLLVPAASGAAASTLKGTVAGSPYVADGKHSAVPVLFAKESARRAHLRSPVGIVILPRLSRLATPAGGVKPGGLRVGDRFTLSERPSRTALRALYPRIETRKAARFRVTLRSSTLSNDELTALLDDTRRDLQALRATVNQLALTTQQGFNDLYARYASLRRDLDAVAADLRETKASLASLRDDLNLAIAELRAEIAKVRADLQPQLDALANALAALTDQLGSCATPTSVIGRLCTLEGQLLALTPPDLGGLTSRVTQISTALTTVVNKLTGSNASGDLPAALNPAITSALTSLAGLQSQVAGLSTNVSTLQGQMGTINGPDGLFGTADDPVGQLQAVVGGSPSTGLQAQLGALQGTVSNVVTSLGSNPDGTSPTVLSNLQGQVTALSTTMSGVQSQLDNPTTGLAAVNASLTQANASIATVNGNLDSTCSSLRSTLLDIIAALRDAQYNQASLVLTVLSQMPTNLMFPTPVPNAGAVAACPA